MKPEDIADALADMITVPGVARAMNVKLTQAQATAVGNLVRDAWLRKYGFLPPKHLSPKTNGSGSHCHAHYPKDWYPKIREIVLMVGAKRDEQGSLF